MIEELRPLLAGDSTIAVVSHVRPDGDALGSSLGLSLFLQGQGYSVTVINPSDIPEYLRWLPGAEDIRSGESDLTGVEAALAEASVLFCLDFGQMDRTEHLEPLLRSFPGTVINLDHHLENEGFTPYRLTDSTASSTCELVFRFIRSFAPEYTPSATVATCLYTGLLTDTGSFRFPSTTPDVLHMAADLLAAGANAQEIHRRVFDSYSERRTRLLGFCLLERLVVLPEFRTAYIALSQADQLRFEVLPGDTEGIVNYALGIRGMNLGVILIEKEDHVRLSFRSIGEFSAAALAEQFYGGGHFNAAGGKEPGELQVAVAKLLRLLPSYAAKLNYEPYAA